MIIRHFGTCQTCNKRYLLRAGIGTENYQIHTFDCLDCGLPVVVAIRATPPHAYFEAEENFLFCEELKENFSVVNFHPNFSFKADSIHDPMAFPSLEYCRFIMPHLRTVPGQKFQDFASQFDVPNARNLWGMVKNAIHLEHNDEKQKSLNKIIKNYEKQRKKYFKSTSVSNVNEMLFNFFDALFYPRINWLINPARNLILKIQVDFPKEYQNFTNFFSKEIKNEQFNRYISIFSDFFKIHTQLGQLMIHARLDDDDIDERIVGSKMFEDVKLYYGQAYETLTSSFVTLAALNNVRLGRRFDEFNSMSLAKYLKDVEKSKRFNPFKDVSEFMVFADSLDSTLRNGSHHASIWREGEKIFYRSGGAGQERNIPYTRYIHMCNRLTISLAAMWLLDREIISGK